MANGVKTYQIKINGIEQSVDAVKSLEKELFNLESRINALGKQTVNVKSSGGGGGTSTSSKSALSEEEKLEKQILQLDAKREAYSKEIYQNYLAAKEVLNETVKDQKQLAASERLSASNYSNTMAGMKQELADIKSVMQTVDLGDTDQFDKLTKRANQLNEELKKIEESYGQFGRNVGNYASAADGLNKLNIVVAGTAQEFDNAKQAYMTFKKELATLQVKKDQGMVLSDEELKRFEELPEIVAQLRSSINDAGKPMDNLMDSMQSIVALAQTGKGLAAFFGVDSDEIERSIQKLVALQNAMSGLQTIQKQLQTKEGIGGWISKASTAIDSFAAGITKTDKAAKALSLTLKAITGLAIVAAIIAATNALANLNKKQKEVNETQEEGLKAYAKTKAELTTLEQRLNSFVGNKKQEKRIVDELNSKYGESLGQYKSLAQWKTVLANKGVALCKVMQKEAEMQAWLNLYTENFIKLQQARKAQEEGNQDTVNLILKWVDGNVSIKRVLASIKDDFMAPLTSDYHNYNDELNKEVEELEKNGEAIMDKVNTLNKEINELNKENKLNDYSDQIDKNTDKTKNALEKETHTLEQLELRLMRDGLAKKLRQMDEEERQTIQKLQENGRKSEDAIKKVQNSYSILRLKAIKEYLKDTEKLIQDTQKNIDSFDIKLNIDKIDNQIAELENKLSKLPGSRSLKTPLTASFEVKTLMKDYGISEDKFEYVKTFEELFNEKDAKEVIDKYYTFLKQYIAKKKESLNDRNNNIFGTEEEEFEYYEELFEEDYKKELQLIRNYTGTIDKTLKDSLDRRFMLQSRYDTSMLRETEKNLRSQEVLKRESLKEQEKDATQAEETRYQNAQKPLEDRRSQLEQDIKNSKARNKKEKESLEELKTSLAKINAEMAVQSKQHYDKLTEINLHYTEEIKKNEIETQKTISSEYEKTFDEQIRNITDAQSKINNLLSNQPKYNAFGIVNLTETKRQYKELESATKTTISKILAEKERLNEIKGLLTPAAMTAIQTQLNDLEESVRKVFQSILDAQKDAVPQFVQSLEQYLQEAVGSFMDIMSAVWNSQDIDNEKEQERLDKLNEMIEDKLSEQEDIINQHKDRVNSIEDELQTARGDRRQHLIDQLNAEIAAERAAQKEKEKAAKQKEAIEHQQDALEEKRKKQQYHRDMLQAVVNGAMAVTMAAVNKWPIPAIPMMALAASTTAAQIAIMASNKPYAKGGLLEGPSHKEGGIPVGNTGIEVEGNEYVIRKKSTAPNIEILDYINKSERKLNLDDFIDFYSSGKLKKNIVQMSPRSRFADGGALPVISNNYGFDDRLLTAFEDYSNRPVVVTVKDINDRQEAVRNVQVLAGLTA